MTTSVNPARGGKANFPYILAQSAVPVCLAPNGTIATNGTVTLNTALPTTYSGGIWLRFPASAVSGDVTGGLYRTIMSSTTVGTVYAGKVDPATEFVPYIGSTAGGAVTGSNSAYTQTTAADVTLVNVTVPGGAMGVNGRLICKEALWSNNNSANNKIPKTKYAGQVIQHGIAGNPLTTLTACRVFSSISNRGTATSNVFNPYIIFGTTNSTAYTELDTSVDQSLVFTAQLATATDYLVLESFIVEVQPS